MLQNSYTGSERPENSITAPSGSSSKAAVADEKKRKSLEALSRKNKLTASTGLCVTEAIKAELNLSQGPPADSETDPLCWKLHEVNSPQVCQLAKKYLCVRATRSTAERVFSSCGNIVICRTVGQYRSQISTTALFSGT